MAYNIIQDKENSRFIVDADGFVSTLDYEIASGKMVFLSTHVHPMQEGKGIASALTEKALTYAVENNLMIVPLCSFTKAYIKRHNEKYKDFVSNS